MTALLYRHNRSLLAALLLVAGVGVQAQTLTASRAFNLSVTLAPQCRATSAAQVALNFGTYTAFGSAVSAGPVTIQFECTRLLARTPTFTWDTTNGAANGDGVLAGLRYSLTATNGTRVDGVAPVLGTAGDIGTPDTYPVNVSGSMLPGQAGAGASGTYSHVRTLTVTF